MNLEIIFITLASLIILLIGANYLVKNIVNLGKKINISNFVIASFTLALGTTIPEFATSLNAAIENLLPDMEEIIKLKAGINLIAQTASREIIGKICSFERFISTNIIDIIETANTAINSRKSLGMTLKKYVKNECFSISFTWRINKLAK